MRSVRPAISCVAEGVVILAPGGVEHRILHTVGMVVPRGPSQPAPKLAPTVVAPCDNEVGCDVPDRRPEVAPADSFLARIGSVRCPPRDVGSKACPPACVEATHNEGRPPLPSAAPLTSRATDAERAVRVHSRTRRSALAVPSRPVVGCRRRLGRKPGRRIAENGGTALPESLGKGRLPGFSMVAGAGFEPATFGL